MLCPKCHKKYSDTYTTCPYCNIIGNLNLLDAIASEYGGAEIFCEENHSRLNKALMTLDESFEPEKDWLLIANMKRIPQKLYAVMDSTQSEKQVMVETCRDALISLTLDEDVCEKIVQSYMSILGINAVVRKKPVIEKQLKEENVVIRYKKSYYDWDHEWIQEEYQYKTCIIGRLEWFAENFHQEYGRDQKCDYYTNSIGNKSTKEEFGRLYDWYQALYNAPKGWRLPTIEDYQDLVSYIQSLNIDSGTALKSTNQWHGNADSGLDLFGFCAYPTEKNKETGEMQAWFWTSSETNKKDYPYYCVSLRANDNSLVTASWATTGYHACVRYVRDVE
jgi:uncharacterized protein (TIGR02145 family)